VSAIVRATTSLRYHFLVRGRPPASLGAGRVHQPRRRFGFVGTGKRRVSRARALAEQEAAREAAARVIEGASLRGIVNDWNERGIKTSTGGRWNTRSLRQMLLSPAIAGLGIHHGKLQAEPAKVKVGPKQWEPVAPILDRETWEQVRAILTDPARTTTVGGGQPKYLLIGMVWCGVCGSRLGARCNSMVARFRLTKRQRSNCMQHGHIGKPLA